MFLPRDSPRALLLIISEPGESFQLLWAAQKIDLVLGCRPCLQAYLDMTCARPDLDAWHALFLVSRLLSMVALALSS